MTALFKFHIAICRSLAAAAFLAAVVACTTTGFGTGVATKAGATAETVPFTWTSKDGGISGSMTASYDGKLYQGRFFQITQSTTADSLDPLWMNWRHGWHDWGYWGAAGPYPTTVFITRYSGKVVASLDAGADHMRCRFHLVDPSRGMGGGGEGECQNSAGQTIRANFAAG
ncbi:hypothetical protein [Duganella vulcania]|uniref:hypothetical protein n=1 Tax=Duganella vulcania TaxID=2692166 RepID=UPI001C2D1D7F|nr:hypothetical protein [Duganella vulcania]